MLQTLRALVYDVAWAYDKGSRRPGSFGTGWSQASAVPARGVVRHAVEHTRRTRLAAYKAFYDAWVDSDYTPSPSLEYPTPDVVLRDLKAVFPAVQDLEIFRNWEFKKPVKLLDSPAQRSVEGSSEEGDPEVIQV